MREDRLAKQMYEYQKQRADENIECWAKRVKDELNRLGLGFLWERQEIYCASKAKFKRVISERIRDRRLTMQREEAGRMKSCKEYVLDRHFIGGLDDELTKCQSFHSRKKYARLMLRSDGAIVRRGNEGKTCIECEELITESTFVHRVLDCQKFKKQREKETFDLRSVPVSERLCHILNNFCDFIYFL